jgi:hypothetical protein
VTPSDTTTRHYLQRWTISGEVFLVGNPPAHVKLGGFYTNCRDFYYASQAVSTCTPACLVSNVASFGAAGGDFTLNIDASLLAPSAGDYIYLILWEDSNENGEYDPLEDWRYVIPLYEDAVFQGATDCIYYYDDRADESSGTETGWNQSIGLGRYAPVRCVNYQGAHLSNEAAWGSFEHATADRRAHLQTGS